jgi:hypothetical protein
MNNGCWLDWSVDVVFDELLSLLKSGWDGIGYMMAAEEPPERLFFVAGDEAFDRKAMLRGALEMHQSHGRVPFLRYYFSNKPNAPAVKQELWRESENGNTVIAALVFSLDVPEFFKQVTAGDSGEYLRQRARLGCMQILGKLKYRNIGSVSRLDVLQGTFGQGGTQ